MKNTKMCSRCLKAKALDEFNVHIVTKDGKQSMCRACSRESARKSEINTEVGWTEKDDLNTPFEVFRYGRILQEMQKGKVAA